MLFGGGAHSRGSEFLFVSVVSFLLRWFFVCEVVVNLSVPDSESVVAYREAAGFCFLRRCVPFEQRLDQVFVSGGC